MKAIELADAIVVDLNDNFDLSGTPFVAERKWLPEYEASKLDKAVVCIVPRNSTISWASRAHSTEVIVIDVAVMRRVDPADLDESDSVIELAMAIRDYLEDKSYANMARVAEMQVSYVNPIHLREHGVIQLLMTYMYKYVR